MTALNPPQIRLSLSSASKRDVRSQFGALCYRILKGKTQILLVTSRDTGRWITPKGWPMPGESPAGCALIEAKEEAGAVGRVYPVCLGIYSYNKTMEDQASLPCVVALYGVRVKQLLDSYPEKSERKRRWFSQKRAAAMVKEPELREIIRGFDPAILSK